MKEALKISKYVFAGVLVVFVVALLHYNLPRTAVVQITGTDTKRIGERSSKQKAASPDRKSGSAATGLRDIRFINSLTREGRILVFRNEDTGWGWPPYFKFDSADITAKAQSFLLMPEKPWVRVNYYGWRIHIFSKFPNIISLKEVPRDYSRPPWFNIMFISLLLVGGIVIWRKLRGYSRRLRNRFSRSDKSVKKS